MVLAVMVSLLLVLHGVDAADNADDADCVQE